jgi:hypothetical protein
MPWLSIISSCECTDIFVSLSLLSLLAAALSVWFVGMSNIFSAGGGAEIVLKLTPELSLFGLLLGGKGRGV